MSMPPTLGLFLLESSTWPFRAYDGCLPIVSTDCTRERRNPGPALLTKGDISPQGTFGDISDALDVRVGGAEAFNAQRPGTLLHICKTVFSAKTQPDQNVNSAKAESPSSRY
jgi:hypothetical protein